MSKSTAAAKEKCRSKDFMLRLNNIKGEGLKVEMAFSNGSRGELERKGSGFGKFKHAN